MKSTGEAIRFIKDLTRSIFQAIVQREKHAFE